MSGRRRVVETSRCACKERVAQNGGTEKTTCQSVPGPEPGTRVVAVAGADTVVYEGVLKTKKASPSRGTVVVALTGNDGDRKGTGHDGLAGRDRLRRSSGVGGPGWSDQSWSGRATGMGTRTVGYGYGYGKIPKKTSSEVLGKEGK
ncbi:hypothetical protein BSKO_11144 [Bryopsis sp. KO-2023]|nr:hypothetical protein BSKO_11144 [Bryopsis sp. KO-2023]